MKRASLAFWALIAAFAAIHWLLLALSPMLADDYWYAAPLPGHPGMADAFAVYLEHLRGDNGRLSNLFFSFMQLLPRGVQAVIPAICTGWLALSVCRFAKPGSRSLLMLSVALLLLTVFLPWFEFMFSICYQFNYIVPAAFTAALLPPLFSGRAPRGFLLVTTLLLGGWNEGFSAPLFVVIVMYALTLHGRRRRNALLWALLLLPGLVWLALSMVNIMLNPKATTRLHYSSDLSSVIVGIVQFAKLPVLFYIFYIIVLARRRFRYGFWIWLPLVTIVINVAMAIVAPRGERLIFLTELLVILCFMRYLVLWLGPARFRNNWPQLSISLLIVAFLAAHFTVVTRQMLLLRHNWPSADRDFLATPEGGVIFVDLEDTKPTNPLSLRKPWPLLLDYFSMQFFNDYHLRPIGQPNPFERRRNIVPLALRNVTATSGEAVPGTAGARKLGCWYFMPCPEGKTVELQGLVGPFHKQFYCYSVVFTSCGDGRKYMFFEPQTIYFPTYLLPIRRFDLRE